jgi:dTDP-4-amino-4,6-dideoxygalactose transaminase
MKVPMLDLAAQYEQVGAQVEKNVLATLRSMQWVLGPAAKRIEEEIASYTGARHAIGLASGSDALLLALQALDIGPGDEVITTPFSFFATASAITRLGAFARFLDIDPRTFNLSPSEVERFLRAECRIEGDTAIHAGSGRTVRAIQPVHLFGQTADMDPLLDLAREFRLAIVEDAAQAIGARYGTAGRPAGTMGEFGCFSFYPSKNLGGVGDGGMAVTGRDDLADRLRRLRNHGDRGGYDHAEVGINSRLDAIQAAALSAKLPWLDQWSDQRARNARTYDELFAERALADRVTLPVTENGNRHIYNQYTIQIDDRDELLAHLRARDVGCAVYYPTPLHVQPCFAFLGYRTGDFPAAERAAARCLSLPIYPELKYVQQRRVVDEIAAFLGKG